MSHLPLWVTLLYGWDRHQCACDASATLRHPWTFEQYAALRRESIHALELPNGFATAPTPLSEVTERPWLWSHMASIQCAIWHLYEATQDGGAQTISLCWDSYLANAILMAQYDFASDAKQYKQAIWSNVWAWGSHHAGHTPYLLEMCRRYDWCWDAAMYETCCGIEKTPMPGLLNIDHHQPGECMAQLILNTRENGSLPSNASWVQFKQQHHTWLTAFHDAADKVALVGYSEDDDALPWILQTMAVPSAPTILPLPSSDLSF